MRAKTALFWLALVFFFALNNALYAQRMSVEHYNYKDFDCALFPSTYPTDFEGTAFFPAHDDVNKACEALLTKLKTTSCASSEVRHEIVKNLTKYKLQFFGYADSKGNKVFFINCFLIEGNKELASSWLHDMIQVDNAGLDFWSVKYNLAKDELYEFNDSGGK